jgi:hypothetical protein
MIDGLDTQRLQGESAADLNSQTLTPHPPSHHHPIPQSRKPSPPTHHHHHLISLPAFNPLIQVRPLEEAFKFGHFFSPLLNDSDFNAKPSVLLLGQYSTGAAPFQHTGHWARCGYRCPGPLFVSWELGRGHSPRGQACGAADAHPT